MGLKRYSVTKDGVRPRNLRLDSEAVAKLKKDKFKVTEIKDESPKK